MKLNINGVDVSLDEAGFSKNGAEKKAGNITMKDGTRLYITAYGPVAKKEEVNERVKPEIRGQSTVSAPVSGLTKEDVLAIIQAAMAPKVAAK